MNFIKALDNIKSVLHFEAVDIYGGTGIDTIHLARFSVIDKPKDGAVICTVLANGVVYPMQVKLSNSVNLLGHSENELLTLLIHALEKAYKSIHDVLVLHRTVGPLTVVPTGELLAIRSSKGHALVQFTTVPNKCCIPFILPEKEGHWYVLASILDLPSIAKTVGNVDLTTYVGGLIKSIYRPVSHHYIPPEITVVEDVTMIMH